MRNDLFGNAGKDRVVSPDQLGRYIKIVTPSAAIMLIGLTAVLLGALIWGFAGSIPATLELTGAYVNTGDSGAPKVLCVADVDGDANALKPGMEVQISFFAAPRDDYGYLLGTVESVSAFPLTTGRLAAQVGSEELADYLMDGKMGKLITIEPVADDETGNRLKWSHRAGGNVELSGGMLCEALILVREQRPIDLILNGEKA